MHWRLNCDILHPTDNGKQSTELLDICGIYGLDNLIKEPTRISSAKEMCLDVILTNVPSFTLKSGTCQMGLGDLMLIYSIFNRKLMKLKPEFVKERTFKNFDKDEYNTSKLQALSRQAT